MEMDCRSRKSESWVYVALWIAIIALSLLDEIRDHAQRNEDVAVFVMFGNLMGSLIPFILLFFVHNYILIPRLVMKNRYRAYVGWTAVALLLFWGYKLYEFYALNDVFPPPYKPVHGPYPRHSSLLPLPLFLDFTCGLLAIGCNLAIALMFQRFDDRFEKERLTKANAESQLVNLKAQINPHFYMNMLNNIHGMIEIDTDVAQKMVLDMSRLMRYMLYESSKPKISLADEIAFLTKYIDIMRIRYDVSKVEIKTSFPETREMSIISLPPLLFLVFVENAFKHGVSYRDKSFVIVGIEVTPEFIVFSCSNSNHSVSKEPGIGLSNIRQRLELLYGGRANLEIEETPNTYIVNLSIPRYEAKDTDN